ARAVAAADHALDQRRRAADGARGRGDRGQPSGLAPRHEQGSARRDRAAQPQVRHRGTARSLRRLSRRLERPAHHVRIRDAEGQERQRRRRTRAGAADQAVRASGQGEPDPVQPVAGRALRMLEPGADSALLRDRVRSGHLGAGAHPARARHRCRLRPAQDRCREEEPRRARQAGGRETGRTGLAMAFTFARYRRPFTVGGVSCEVVMRAKIDGLHSELRVAGMAQASDYTPATGPEAIRNHCLAGLLPSGERFEVEAGYISWVSVGIAVRRDGQTVHESYPGRTIAFPKSAVKMTADPGLDMSRYKANRVPIAVDIALGLLFFVIAKYTDLSTAAIVGAVAGLALLVIQ